MRFVLPRIAHHIYKSGRYHMLSNVWGVCGDRVGIAKGNVGSGERPNNVEKRVTRHTTNKHSTQPPDATHNPLRAQAKHLTEAKKFHPSEGFCEHVRGIKVTRYMRNGYQLAIDVVPYPVVHSMDVLHGTLMLRMFHDLDSQFIIKEEWRRTRHVVADLLEKVTHPHNFASDLGRDSVLGFGGRERDVRLQMAAPLYSATTDGDHKAACGSTVVRIPTQVRI